MNRALRILMTGLLVLLAACTKKSSIPAIQGRDASIYDDEIITYLRANNLSAEKDPSGLYYKVLEYGDSTNYARATSVPSLIYNTQLLSGEVIGSSFDATDFDGRQLMNHIPGWQIGLQKITKGGRIKLYIPPHLAFGPVGIDNLIPPNAVLLCELELVDLK
ncbi:FKBP-type peptidyl-prolyl cis-trans isomerase [Chitinophaga nivalis]|uniref:Peptidyl-prolyl cis-trans isomerase n=1 Tax=Chitinophaga nivalis TaxID=2991709 RepID=A0ABT3IQG2_9BACT|nr:FKBP-type peptidyl-prolyl cis-trans isomerase [Chitinophaga nivalis]MCW3464299.1 FKBP-type peptidyl-prolyl cis-trans isomerase [Chitinophaga nivalis]MCW3486010.1 FKBP-type peptidyl-prolyl cis-trans isomerase [Chitinophaga nivalis]